MRCEEVGSGLELDTRFLAPSSGTCLAADDAVGARSVPETGRGLLVGPGTVDLDDALASTDEAFPYTLECSGFGFVNRGGAFAFEPGCWLVWALLVAMVGAETLRPDKVPLVLDLRALSRTA